MVFWDSRSLRRRWGERGLGRSSISRREHLQSWMSIFINSFILNFDNKILNNLALSLKKNYNLINVI